MNSFPRLQKLTLKNFRRFSSFEIDFHPELTVIVSRNGEGKTSVLDAITIAFGTFVGAFDLGKAKHIDQSDVKLFRRDDGPENERQFPVEVNAVVQDTDGIEQSWHRELTGPKNRTTTKDARFITDYGEQLQQQLRTDTRVDLPVIAYYGTGRLWQLHKNIERKSVVLSESRTMGYEDCLSPSSNFIQLQQWMAKATKASIQQQDIPGYEKSNIPVRLEGISRVVNKIFEVERWNNFHFSLTLEELVMRHPEQGILPVSSLSDGVRSMVSLAADLAWRCTRLNGHWGADASRKTKGLVLIDEVDLHLHPVWQQRVITSLQEAFPEIQFIVATHSPQVLTTVKKECIRIISWENEVPAAFAPTHETYAQESRTTLEDVLGAQSRPPLNINSKIFDYLRRIEDGEDESPEVQQLRIALERELGAGDSQLQLADMLIFRNQAKRKARR
jgi:predicted ATP-binding protein involved in virulence